MDIKQQNKQQQQHSKGTLQSENEEPAFGSS